VQFKEPVQILEVLGIDAFGHGKAVDQVLVLLQFRNVFHLGIKHIHHHGLLLVRHQAQVQTK
jgi:hypothetical protein